jgi:hypothetical protein
LSSIWDHRWWCWNTAKRLHWLGWRLWKVSFFFHTPGPSSEVKPRIYYQFSPDRLSTCLVTIHGLLHIADGIPASGPDWVSWAFPIERFCGSLAPSIKSRRFPYASISRHLTEAAQLTQIKLTHNLSEILALSKPKGPVQGQFYDITTCMFVLLTDSCLCKLI